MPLDPAYLSADRPDSCPLKWSSVSTRVDCKWMGFHADATSSGWPCMLQGTYLPAKIGLDLEEMQRHSILQDLGKQVKNLYEKLHLQHDLLRGGHPELSGQQPVQTPSLIGKISGRLESISSWKYAPQPLRSMRSSLTGELPHLCT